MIEPKIFTVSQINKYIRNLFENDFILNSMWIKGEISNFKNHSSGHLYFTLKDKNSAISCVMFKGSAIDIPFMPENGMSVIICGYISLYEKTGQYQVYAELMEPAGVGGLNKAFEQLKERLSEEGIFDEDYKRDICKFPKQIAVITSSTGAAVRDIIQIAKRRNKNVSITVVPVLVQGENAAGTIVEAIRMVNVWGKADTIILGRGGGSIEDLWAFNEEKVARAIFASNIPIISAVGHETDFTISDFVSDLRAPTPSAAAELAVNDLNDTVFTVNMLFKKLNSCLEQKINSENKFIDTLLNRPVFKRPLDKVINYQIYIDGIDKELKKEVTFNVEKSKNRFINVINRLEAVSLVSVLKRGFSVVSDDDGNIIKSINDADINEKVNINIQDGYINAIVCGKVSKDA